MARNPRSPRPLYALVALCLLTALTLFSSGSAAAGDDGGSASARATIKDATGATLGSVTIQQTRHHTVIVSARVTRLGAGFHGFHVHAVGKCDPTTTDPTTGNPAPFLSAGPHFDVGGHTHGTHTGDLPALLVMGAGSAQAAVETDRFTVAGLLDADGSAIIVHAGPDNLANIPTRYTSATTGQPGPDAATLGTGDSGGRTACGVVTRSY
jgi:superoxide dismutase, Cu-Zn family